MRKLRVDYIHAGLGTNTLYISNVQKSTVFICLELMFSAVLLPSLP